jgi:hypothetical protein
MLIEGNCRQQRGTRNCTAHGFDLWAASSLIPAGEDQHGGGGVAHDPDGRRAEDRHIPSRSAAAHDDEVRFLAGGPLEDPLVWRPSVTMMFTSRWAACILPSSGRRRLASLWAPGGIAASQPGTSREWRTVTSAFAPNRFAQARAQWTAIRDRSLMSVGQRIRVGGNRDIRWVLSGGAFHVFLPRLIQE